MSLDEQELLALLERVLADAGGREGVEAYAVDDTETTVKAYGGEVEALSSARTRGVGIRVVADGRAGYAWTADTGETALRETLAAARENATVATPDDANRLPEASTFPDVPGLYDPAFADVRPEDKVALALALEAAVRDAGPPIKGVDSAQYVDALRTAAIVSTTGVRGAYTRGDAYVLVEALAEADGSTTSAYGLDLARVPTRLDIGATAAEAVQRATRLLGGRKPPSGRLPVLLDPFAAASLLGVIAGALTGDAVQKGRSLFADRLGERLGPAHLTLVDDGTLAEAPAASPWDAEGVPSSRTILLAEGVLQGWLHNTFTAAKDGTDSTGNARRGVSSPPGVGITNLCLLPGQEDSEALLASAGTAFYCQRLLGLHSGANPVSGDFSVGASGLMVRDGAFAEPVREATIAGTLPEILAGLAAVGSDLRWLPFGGGIGATTLLVESMTIAGT